MPFWRRLRCPFCSGCSWTRTRSGSCKQLTSPADARSRSHHSMHESDFSSLCTFYLECATFSRTQSVTLPLLSLLVQTNQLTLFDLIILNLISYQRMTSSFRVFQHWLLTFFSLVKLGLVIWEILDILTKDDLFALIMLQFCIFWRTLLHFIRRSYPQVLLLTPYQSSLCTELSLCLSW